MNIRYRFKDEQSSSEKIDYTKQFEDIVNSFLDPNLIQQKDDFEHQIDEWRSDISYIPKLNGCILQTKFPNVLFFSSLCIKFLLEKFNKEIAIEDISDIFSAIHERLQCLYEGTEQNKNEEEDKKENEVEEEEEEGEREKKRKEEEEMQVTIMSEFQKCRVNLLKCISLIQTYYPDFIEKVDAFSFEDRKILLSILFEEESSQIPDAHNMFTKKMSVFQDDQIKLILKKTELSKEWLLLFKYGLQKTSEIDNYSDLYEKKLSKVPEHPNLYPQFIEIFQECIDIEYFYYSKRSADFLVRIFDLVFEIIEKLLSQPSLESVQMASYLWKEAIDYDIEFIEDCYASLNDKKDGRLPMFLFFIESLKIINQIDDEFFLLCESVSETLGQLVGFNYKSMKKNLASNEIIPNILKYLSFLIECINRDPCKYAVTEIASSFIYVSKNNIPLIAKFYNEILQPQDIEGVPIISPGALFAIASSNEELKEEYSLKVSDNVINNIDNLPPDVVFYFICECNSYCGQRIHNFMEFSFNSIGSDFDRGATNTIVKYCKYHPQTIIDSPEYLNTICEFETNPKIENVYAIVNSIQALLYIMNYAKSEHEAYTQCKEAIEKGVLEKVINFYENDESCKFVLDFINEYAKMVNETLPDIKDYPILCEFLVELCSQIIDKINFTNVFYGFAEEETKNEDSKDDESKELQLSSLIQKRLCDFVSTSLDSDMIQNKDYIIEWIGVSLSKNPVTDHIDILIKISDLFPTDLTKDFILNVGNSEDNEMMIASLRFVKYLADQNWDPFFSTFPNDYFLGPLESPDTRIIDITLEIIKKIIDIEIESKQIFFENDHYDIVTKITDCVFTNFEDIEIRMSINIWIKLFEAELIEVRNLAEFVLTKIPEKCGEYYDFCQSLSPGEYGFDRIQILRNVYNLKTSLELPS